MGGEDRKWRGVTRIAGGGPQSQVEVEGSQVEGMSLFFSPLKVRYSNT